MTAIDDSTREILRETANRRFQALCQPAVLRAAEEEGWPGGMWAAVEESGLPRALAPESSGGHGLSFPEAMVIVRAAGRNALPLPLPETMLAGWLLARAGLPVPDGPMTVVFGDTLSLSPVPAGLARRVPWAREHTSLVVMDRAGRVAMAPREDCQIERGENVAGEPRDTVVLGGKAQAMGNAGIDITGLRAVGAVLRSQQMAGALESLTEMTVQYALDRVQFGKPLGKFQAVQQNLAVLAGQTAAAIAAADMAAEAVEGTLSLLTIAAAKGRCGEAAGVGAAIAHQVHGAIGFTREHGLHHLTKRLWSWRDEFGNETVWNRLLGHHMAKVGADGFWARLTAL